MTFDCFESICMILACKIICLLYGKKTEVDDNT